MYKRQLQLVPGQLHRLAPQGGGAPGEMEGEGPGGEGVRLAPLPRPAEDRLDPGQEDGDVVGLGDVVVAPQAEGLQLVQGGVPAEMCIRDRYWAYRYRIAAICSRVMGSVGPNRLSP